MTIEWQDLTLGDVYLARQRIQTLVRRTPLADAPALSQKLGAQVMLKLENLQGTGAFKMRGATNKLLSLSEEERARGVVTCSSGNHGRALSYVTQKLGVHAVICLPEPVPENKREAIRRLGAEVIIAGNNADEAMAYADKLAEERQLTMVSAFDDPYVITGQGTIGLELLEDFPQIDTAIIPLSGGSLLSGISLALKSAKPDLCIIGVSMERGPAMVRSLEAGKVVEIVEEPTIADGLAGGLGEHNHYTFPLVQKYIDETVLVSEEEIADAMAFALDEHRLVVEGAGAVGMAAILSGKVKQNGQHVAVVISGSNVNLPLLLRIAREHGLG
ncbi:MAG: hydroxyectoine utilization dehydratase EutB [Anaerolineaceae bacterium]|jgi:threonine dehydratase|nr:hydroxyectoine utilization dehydratase EutB [Anaerolineaceae bacterium]